MPSASSVPLDVGAGAPAEALLAALRRAWRNAEGRRVHGASPIAPAGHVARAVGTLLVGAATHELRGAARGAAAGCAPGVARVVDVSLARQVLEAIPYAQEDVDLDLDLDEVRPVEPTGIPAGLGRAPVPPPSWWCRESGWNPRVLPDAGAAGRENAGHALIATLWPPLPDAPERRATNRATPTRRPIAVDDALEAQAWRILEAELQPGDWTMAPRTTGGPR